MTEGMCKRGPFACHSYMVSSDAFIPHYMVENNLVCVRVTFGTALIGTLSFLGLPPPTYLQLISF
jgi:hypothetical protein